MEESTPNRSPQRSFKDNKTGSTKKKKKKKKAEKFTEPTQSFIHGRGGGEATR